MFNYNRVILAGNLTRDPELRYAPNGTALANFTLAINHRYRKGNEFVDEVSYVDVVCFGKQAETCVEYLSKGRTVLVEGRLRQRKWDGPEGQKRSKIEVIARMVRFIGGPRDESALKADINIPEEEEDVPF